MAKVKPSLRELRALIKEVESEKDKASTNSSTWLDEDGETLNVVSDLEWAMLDDTLGRYKLNDKSMGQLKEQFLDTGFHNGYRYLVAKALISHPDYQNELRLEKEIDEWLDSK